MRDRSKPAPTNELSVVGFVCGVLALLLSLVPWIGSYMFWVFAVPALIFGGVGIHTGLRFGVRKHIAILALLFTLGSFVVAGFWLLLPTLVGILADRHG